MYKITQIDNRRNGVWTDPTIDWTALKSNGYEGAYILAHQIIKNDAGQYVLEDNKYLADIYDEAVGNGFRVGFYIIPDGIKLSYAKEFQDLSQKCNARSFSLLPAVIVGQWPSGYTPHQVIGDFVPYYNSILIEKYGNAVLGLNKSTFDFLANSGNNDIILFLRQSGLRLWYFRPPFTAIQMNAESLSSPAKKEVWIAGVSAVENQANWKASVSSPSASPSSSPSPSTIFDPKKEIAYHLRIIADLVEQL